MMSKGARKSNDRNLKDDNSQGSLHVSEGSKRSLRVLSPLSQEKDSNKNEELRAKEEKEALEHKKFPSILKIKQMGVKNFKPTILHRVLYMGNATKDTEKFQKLGPKVETTWPGGLLPKYDQRAKSTNEFVKSHLNNFNQAESSKVKSLRSRNLRKSQSLNL